MTIDEINVRVHGRNVARLIEHDSGEGGYDLRYLPEAGSDDFVGLALSDVLAGRYDGYQEVPSVLLQNLPEGASLEIVRRAVGKTLNIASEFGLLKVIGPYFRGRISIGGDHADQGNLDVAAVLKEKGTEQLFNAYFDELGIGAAAVSGVQPKMTAQIDNRATAVFSDVIVKFRPFATGVSGLDFPGLAINEYFCLRAASFAGIEEVANAQLSEFGEMLVVKRFDLPSDEPALGFEDACSLTELAPKYKYHGDYAEMFELLSTWVPPENRLMAKSLLFRLLVLNVFLGNGDAHRKNHAVLYSSLQTVRIAPAFDLVSTVFYMPNDSMALALDAGGSKSWPGKKQLLRLATESLGLSKRQVQDAFDSAANGVLRAAGELETYLQNGPEEGGVLRVGIKNRRPLADLWRHQVDRFMLSRT